MEDSRVEGLSEAGGGAESEDGASCATGAALMRGNVRRTVTSTVFSWPTKEISCFHSWRWMMAAVKTAAFMAFEDAMNAPSGDQLQKQMRSKGGQPCRSRHIHR